MHPHEEVLSEGFGLIADSHLARGDIAPVECERYRVMDEAIAMWAETVFLERYFTPVERERYFAAMAHMDPTHSEAGRIVREHPDRLAGIAARIKEKNHATKKPQRV